ncbi:LppX_LprAFG lipoprotein [Nocardioides sp. C4-1]|uniref:LppX_LprAFG lipoprotein n=1 Tax=Nocardioides sp. C4-1 TaxID=3151851 RepID=UPI003263D312
MSHLPHLRRTAAAAVLVITAAVGLSACSGDDGEPAGNPSADTDGDGVSPAEALGFAKTRLDETSGVRLTLATEDSPDADAFLSEATGVITADPPAFEGKASGSFGGLPADGVDIISVDGTTYVNLLGSFSEFPLPECVPDPAGLLDPDTGFATVLTAADDVEAGEQQRGGADNDEIFTPYTATVPGTAVTNLLPCAPGESFQATFDLDDDGLLRNAEITGEFFPEVGEVTYTIAIDEYDVEQEITAP